MLFRQILSPDLACASYVLASDGEGLVVDPRWEVDVYLELAALHGFRVAAILETHTHADHVSGRGRLAAATGARVLLPRGAGAAHPHETIGDGDRFEIGQVRVSARATPGHRPEHLAYLVEDLERGEGPWLVLTGDSLFVSDIARPDLAVEAEDGARDLFRSFHALLELDDTVEVWPAHVGGSKCGGPETSEKPSSTIGYERRRNRYLGIADEDDFVATVTGSLGLQPGNLEAIVALNRGPLLSDAAPLPVLAPARVQELLDAGAVLVDGREPREYDAAHVPGSLNVTLIETGAGTRAGWALRPEDEVVVVGGSDAEAVDLARRLEAVGLRNLRGRLAGGMAAWRGAGLRLQSTSVAEVADLPPRLQREEVRLLDVREPDEWDEGHVPGSLHVPYHTLADGVPASIAAQDGRLAVICAAGIRSSLAASLLRRAGVDDLEHVAQGGVDDLEAAGVELVRAG